MTKYNTQKEIKDKIERYCAYQERSHFETRIKLVELGARGLELEEILVSLIQNNFLNEERFAQQYAQGKMRIKNWGRVKIKLGLKAKKVPDKIIDSTLKQLDNDEYYHILKKLLEKKSESISEKNTLKRRYTLVKYAISRGFEHSLITEMLSE